MSNQGNGPGNGNGQGGGPQHAAVQHTDSIPTCGLPPPPPPEHCGGGEQGGYHPPPPPPPPHCNDEGHQPPCVSHTDPDYIAIPTTFSDMSNGAGHYNSACCCFC